MTVFWYTTSFQNLSFPFLWGDIYTPTSKMLQLCKQGKGEKKKHKTNKQNQNTTLFAYKSSWKSNHNFNSCFSRISGKQVELNHPFPKGDFKHLRLIRNSLPRSFTWP